MKILISGATGLVGSALMRRARDLGDEPVQLARPGASNRGPAARGSHTSVTWDAAAGTLGSGAEGADAFVHLAGASIAQGRWTAHRKRILRESRVDATHQLVGALRKLRQPPSVFVAASAVGVYGDRGDEILSETTCPGGDFLAALSRDWEAESDAATAFGARVVLLRFGVILARGGGALPRMVLPFRLGAGGPIGSGKQWMSWIALEDAVSIIYFALRTNSAKGPVNAVAPSPVRNADFAQVLGRVLHRPAFVRTPSFVLRLALGEVADALLLSSQRAIPESLGRLGYEFKYPELRPALESVLKRARP